jgi:opacity protein-like surface antigen
MKKLFLFASVVLLSAGISAQAQQATQKKAEDVVKFKELTHDFGKIKQGSPVTYDFAFTNISDAPVIIESATPSCGCTTPVKPEGAIQKGKDDKITAGFNAAAAGPFNKSITIKVAGVDLPVQLKIVGEVLTVDAYTKYEASKGNKSGR